MSQVGKRGLLLVIVGGAWAAVLAVLNGGGAGTGWEIYNALYPSVRSEVSPRTTEIPPVLTEKPRDLPAVPLSATTPEIAPTAPIVETNQSKVAMANPVLDPRATSSNAFAPPAPMQSMNNVGPMEHPEVATRLSVGPKEIVVKGQDPFSICGYGEFQATIASGGSAVILKSRNRQLPESRISGWEKVVDVGAKTMLFYDCEVIVDLKDMVQDKFIVIKENIRGDGKT